MTAVRMEQLGDYHDDSWGRRAVELVNGNAQRHPELLAGQLATAMRGEAAAIDRAYQMRTAMALCLRLVERAKVKPIGDEIELLKIAEEYAFLHPARAGGNQWIEPDQLRLALNELEVTESCESEEAA